MATNEEYWRRREQANIKREILTDEQRMAEIRRIINIARMEIIKDIESFYTRYAGGQGMTVQEAKKRASEFDVQQYEALAKRYVEERNFSDKANKMLKMYNLKMKVSRQELLMMQLNAHLTAMANGQVQKFQQFLETTAYAEVARQASILGLNMVITPESVQAIVGASFHHHVWSTRIWNDMQGLRNELDHIINSAIIRGKHPNRYVPDIRERFQVSTYEAKRLLQTESARVQVSAQKKSYEAIGEDLKEEGITPMYEYIAKLDDRTTKICQGMDGKKFKVSEMVPGVTAPPKHPNCRSSTSLTLGDWRTPFFEKRKGKYVL